MEIITVKRPVFSSFPPFSSPPYLPFLSTPISFCSSFSKPQKPSFFLPSLPKSNTPTSLPPPILFHTTFTLFSSFSGHSGDRHCAAVVVPCLSEDGPGPALALSSIEARVSSKAAIQPAQSLPTGKRPTKERGGGIFAVFAPSEAACLHHLV